MKAGDVDQDDYDIGVKFFGIKEGKIELPKVLEYEIYPKDHANFFSYDLWRRSGVIHFSKTPGYVDDSVKIVLELQYAVDIAFLELNNVKMNNIVRSFIAKF